jgi:hypothetical protein
MAKPSIENLRGIGDVASVYRWNMSFSKSPSVDGFPSSEDINLRCESVTLPSISIEPVTIQIRGHKVFQPGIIDYGGTFSLTIIETIDNKISDMIKGWREACWEVDTGKGKPKADIEANIKLERLDNEDNTIWTYELIGCWLQSVDGLTLDSTTSDPMRVTLTLQYDYYKESA